MHSNPTGTVFTGPDQSYVIMLPHTIGLRLFHEDLAISSKAFAFVAPAVLPHTLSDGFSILLQLLLNMVCLTCLPPQAPHMRCQSRVVCSRVAN